MSEDRDEVNDFLFGGGAKSFPFDAVGDSVTGEITHMEKRQQTDLQTGQPATWDDGNPKMMLVVKLQTDLQEDEDDSGERSVYLRGGNPQAVTGTGTSSLGAVREAVKASKAAGGLEQGGLLTLTYSGEGKASGRAFSPPKLYTAVYKAPVMAVNLDDMA